MLNIYNPGKYVFCKETRFLEILTKVTEYINGVTISRSTLNRKKPQVVEKMNGDIIDIGGYDNFFKEKYKNGKYLNVDIVATPYIDLVIDIEDMKEIESDTLGGVICISVLEHTLNPENAILEIFRCLKPGGLAYISNPWLFETHMEPYDFRRFSQHLCEFYFGDFEVIDVDYTNSYFGLIAHVLQHNFLLRFSLGLVFFILDMFTPNEARWATQISYVLKKPSN